MIHLITIYIYILYIYITYISLSNSLWSNLLKKTAITTTFYFLAEEESICLRKKLVSINSMGHDLDTSFL